MKLGLVKNDGETITWAYKSKPATIGGKISVMGVLPFLLLIFMPYSTIFWLVLINFLLDIYKTKTRATRWADVLRRYRFILNGGYWRPHTTQFIRQTKRSWGSFKGIRY